MNKWEIYKSFYADAAEQIEATPSTEFAFQPVGWEDFFQMTPIERWMWEELRNSRMVMYPQYPAFGFFLDFANPKAKVAIECDGAAFHTDWQKDRARDNILGEDGWTVYRFTGRQCAQEPDYETGEPSEMQELLAEIRQQFPVQRIAKQSGWIHFGRDAAELNAGASA